MSTTYYASTDSRAATSDLARSLKDAFAQAQSIGRAVSTIAGIAGATQTGVMQRVMQASGLPTLPMPSLQRARGCRLPECDCHSTDLGEIRKVVDTGRDVRLAFRLRNTTKTRRTFGLVADPVVGDNGQPGGGVKLSVDHVDLDPGETAIVEADFIAAGQEPGVNYGSTVVISSANCETMRLRLTVMVERETAYVPVIDLHCCCHPRLRPLRWYHHYYCDPKDGRDVAAGQVAQAVGLAPAAEVQANEQAAPKESPNEGPNESHAG